MTSGVEDKSLDEVCEWLEDGFPDLVISTFRGKETRNCVFSLANLSRVWTSKSYVTFVHDLIQKMIWTALLLPLD